MSLSEDNKEEVKSNSNSHACAAILKNKESLLFPSRQFVACNTLNISSSDESRFKIFSVGVKPNLDSDTMSRLFNKRIGKLTRNIGPWCCDSKTMKIVGIDSKQTKRFNVSHILEGKGDILLELTPESNATLMDKLNVIHGKRLKNASFHEIDGRGYYSFAEGESELINEGKSGLETLDPPVRRMKGIQTKIEQCKRGVCVKTVIPNLFFTKPISIWCNKERVGKIIEYFKKSGKLQFLII